MDAWTRMLRAVALTPGLVVSTAVWLMVAALLPAGLGGLLLLCGLVLLVLLWSGRSGRLGWLVDQVGAVLAGAREPTPAEQLAFAPVLSRLAELEVDQLLWQVGRSGRSYPAARPFGRDQVVVSPVLVEAVFHGQVGVNEAAALVAHARGWLRAQPTRGEIAIAAWMLPWRALSPVIARVGGTARWVPLVGFAWQLRFVVGAIAVVQSAAEGRALSAIVVAVSITTTYVTPTARRARGARLQAAADQYVATPGLGPALLSALQRIGAPTPDLERVSRLQLGRDVPVPVGPARPLLRLVTT
jgi:hypothetical protein